MINLLSRINDTTKKFEEIDLLSGRHFNIFNILKLTTNEVRLHSQFIAELLDAKGSHGQKAVFLNHFIKDILCVENFDCESAKVEIEKYIGKTTDVTGGRIDIFISDKANNSIVIENKIYAGDQNNQLVRYYNFSNKNIFYLNLWGAVPNESSCGNLQADKDYKIISYREHIIPWLELCRKEAVDLPLLREGISHYLNLIKHLVGQSNNKKMANEIRDIITESSLNLKNAIQIEQSVTDAKIDIQWKFWVNLKSKLNSVNDLDVTFKADKEVTWQNVKGFYEKSRNKDINYGLWYKIYQKDDISIHFGIEISTNICYGFTIEKNGNGGIAEQNEYESIREMIISIDPTYVSSKWWLGWRYTNPQLNFREFNSEAIFDLANKDKMMKTVEDIAIASVNDITLLQSKLSAIDLGL